MNRKERRAQEKAAKKEGTFDPSKARGTEVSNFLFSYATGTAMAPNAQPAAPVRSLEDDLAEAARLGEGGRVQDMYAHAQKMLADHNDHPDAHYMAGLATFHLGQGDEALSHFTAAIDGKCRYIDPAMYAAELYLQRDDLQKAEEYTNKHLENEPDEPGSLMRLGYLQQVKGEFADAADSFERARVSQPDNTDLLINLGYSYFQTERFSEAINCYQDALKLDPAQGRAHLNLGLAHLQMRDVGGAREAYGKALELLPDNIEALFGYAKCLRADHQYQDAVEHYAKVIEQDPSRADAHWEMGSALEAIGEKDQAIQAYKECLALAPGHETASHLLSALEGNTQDEAPREYVEGLFDDFAESFDDTLVNQLDYVVPGELRAALEAEGAALFANGPIGSALDLGCGTGLVGEQVRSLVTTSHGIDLSQKMIDQADAKGVYDQTWATDINTFLEDSAQGRERYDVILSGDVFVYMGALERTFGAVAKRLLEGGLFIFTVEDTDAQDTFQVKSSGRYGHGDGYVTALAEINGLGQVSSKKLALRKDGDETVTGRLVVLQKG